MREVCLLVGSVVAGYPIMGEYPKPTFRILQSPVFENGLVKLAAGENGLLYFQLRPTSPRRLCVHDVPGLRKCVLFEEHDVPTRGHPGQAKTLLHVLEKFYWKGMAATVDHYVASCELCQRKKAVRGKAVELFILSKDGWTSVWTPDTTSHHHYRLRCGALFTQEAVTLKRLERPQTEVQPRATTGKFGGQSETMLR